MAGASRRALLVALLCSAQWVCSVCLIGCCAQFSELFVRDTAWVERERRDVVGVQSFDDVLGRQYPSAARARFDASSFVDFVAERGHLGASWRDDGSDVEVRAPMETGSDRDVGRGEVVPFGDSA